MAGESRLLKEARKFLKSLKKCWFVKLNDSCTMGLPDIIGCYFGVFFAIELKSEEGRPTALQTIILNLIRMAGGQVCVARTLSEIQSFIGGVKDHARNLERSQGRS